MLSSGSGRGSRSRKLAAAVAVQAALTRARLLRGLEDGGRGRACRRWGLRRRQGPRERGAPPPLLLGSVPSLGLSRPGSRSGEVAGPGSHAQLGVGQGSARASTASWAPSSGLSGQQPREYPGLLAAEPERPRLLQCPLPPPSFFPCPRHRYRFSSPLWQRSHHPPSGTRPPAPQK